MQLTGRITLDSLMSVEAYSQYRQINKAALMAQRRLRTVRLGANMSLQFESEATVRYQIQEMLRIEKIVDQAACQHEIDAFTPLVPDGHNWKATLFLEYPDPNERQKALTLLIGVEDHLFIEVQGHGRVHAIADEDLDRERADKTSAVHFVRFEFDAGMQAAIQSGAPVTLGCDHPAYLVSQTIEPACVQTLSQDLK